MKTILLFLVVTFVATQAVRAGDEVPAAQKPTATTTDHKPDDAVARLGEKTILWKDLDAEVNRVKARLERNGRTFPPERLSEMRYNILDQMITRELVLDKARGHEPAGLDEKVKEQLAAIKQRFGGEEGLSKALEEDGLTQADLAKQVREGILMEETLQAYVDSQIKVTPEDVKGFYDSNPEKFKRPESVRASHILITVPADASEQVKQDKHAQIEAARSLIKNGDKFADVARKFSEDPVSARNGGDLDYFYKGQMVPEFEATAFSLKTNELSDVITTKFGYHILMVTDRRPASTVAFDEAKADIEKFLRNSKSQPIAQEHLKQLREQAKVEVLLKRPEPRPMFAPQPMGSSKPPVTVETPPVAAPKP
jgi:peptidyl-prolyl cis-trans isomerase C